MHVLWIIEGYPTTEDPGRCPWYQPPVEALNEQNVRVGVLAISQKPYPNVRSFWQGLKHLRIRVDNRTSIPIYYDYLNRSLPSFPLKRILRRARALRLVAMYIRQFGSPDVVHAHRSSFAGGVAAELKHRLGIPYILTEHSTNFLAAKLDDSTIKLAEHAFRSADACTAVSSTLGRALERHLKDAVQPWTVVPNSVDGRFFDICTRTNGKRLTDEFSFFNLGSLEPQKGQDILIRAFAAQFLGDAKVSLCIGGEGRIRRHLEALGQSLGVGPQVRFLGRINRDEVRKEMQLADAFVVSSRYETFGVPLIESLACGTPVISTSTGAAPEIVNCSNGILVPPGDVQSLGEGLAQMRKFKTHYDPQSIRRSCLSRFDSRSVASQLKAIYSEIA